MRLWLIPKIRAWARILLWTVVEVGSKRYRHVRIVALLRGRPDAYHRFKKLPYPLRDLNTTLEHYSAASNIGRAGDWAISLSAKSSSGHS